MESKYMERTIPFRAGDGLQCNLVNVKGEERPPRGPVLVVHGAGVRANIFRAPVKTNFVDYLVQQGYDVWLENWRASIDIGPNEWDLDQAAQHDHPEAVKKVVEETGYDEIKAVIHCQGSTSFMMSAVAGLVPQVSTVVSNAVSLHPVVPDFSRFKLSVALPLVALGTKYLNPQWGNRASGVFPKIIRTLVEATHHECDNGVCKQVSFTYGSGFPALWKHENLNDATHEWLKQEFAEVPIRFFNHIKKCIRQGHLVAFQDDGELPDDYTARPPDTGARFAFFAGEENLCFLPESQVRTHKYFEQREPGRHALHVLPKYSHLDVFMGQNAAEDVFPLIVEELEK
ncbi:alpha/beta fold hydrolase [Halalkalibaculum sp. DA384]|uniref:alpha/beta fold hydrolase n=1 Tax=Halalkalibaculum sp. DA384 TaxID=3373606 RepID=UPI003754830B